jgi:3-phosphoshikimate 1-carboxyvinyltransferase
LRLVGVGLNPTRTGLLDALRSMGGHIEIHSRRVQHGEPLGDLVVRHSRLQGTLVGSALAVRMIDEFPAFAIAAAVAEGASRVEGAAELRYKETDRIAALGRGLQALGVPLRERPDGFELPGGARLQGGLVPPFGDHRMVMALAVAGLAAQAPVVIQGAEMVDESFPGFTGTLQALGAEVAMEEERQ